MRILAQKKKVGTLHFSHGWHAALLNSIYLEYADELPTFSNVGGASIPSYISVIHNSISITTLSLFVYQWLLFVILRFSFLCNYISTTSICEFWYFSQYTINENMASEESKDCKFIGWPLQRVTDFTNWLRDARAYLV